MIFDLAQDFREAVAAMPKEHPRHRMLKLFEEAIRRDIHFIARHPTTLFQCLWNTCWWYDCPEATKHYETAGDESLQPPWKRIGRKMHELLQDWHARKESHGLGVPWLRSMRPPRFALNQGLRHIFRTSHPATSVAFSPDGRRLACGSTGGQVFIWDLVCGSEVRFKQDSPIAGVAFSPDGSRVVVAPRHEPMTIWDSVSGTRYRVFPGDGAGILSFASSLDWARFVCGCDDGTVKVWDAVAGKLLISVPGDARHVTCVVVSPDGSRVASLSGGWLRIWQTGSPDRRISVPLDANGGLSFSPCGGRIAVGSMSEVLVFDSVTGKELMRCSGPGETMRSLVYAPDGLRIVAVSGGALVGGGIVCVWDAGTCRLTGWTRIGDDYMRAVAWSPDGELIACASRDGTVAVLSASSPGPGFELRGHRHDILCIACSPEGRHVVSGSIDNTARVWDAETGTQLSVLDDQGVVRAISYSTDGRRFVLGSLDRCVRVWDVGDSGAPTLVLEKKVDVYVDSVALSSEGALLAAGLDDGVICLWNVMSRAEIARLRGHGGSVSALAFSPDGLRLSSASNDGTVRVWNITNGTELAVLEAPCPFCRADMAYSPDGSRLIVSEYDTDRVMGWDTRSYEAVDAGFIVTDSKAIAAGSPSFPLLAYPFSGETILMNSDPDADFMMMEVAGPLEHITAHPSGRIWIGNMGDYLSMLKLEAFP